MEVIFIRHGQAESNINPIEKGIVGSDLELTVEGIRQSQDAATYLAQLAIKHIIRETPKLIYHSPYKRAKNTAMIIAANFPGCDLFNEFSLKEIQKGDWHGKPVADIIALENAISDEDRPHFRAPKGENWQDVADRMVGFITERETNAEKTVYVVSHNHPIEAAIGSLTGIPITQWEDRPVDNAGITRVYKDGDLWRIDERVYNYPFSQAA
jgi:broad specificity phosphatase PhoE